MNRRAYFIVNPHSSNGRTGRIWPSFRRILERRLGRVHFALTRGILHARDLAARALQDGYDLILAVGGDGTVNEVLNGFYATDGAAGAGRKLLRPQVALGYLSSGTGGDLSRTLSYHDCPLEQQAELLLESGIRRIDCGEVAFHGPSGEPAVRKFINASSAGFSGNVLHAMNRFSKLFGGKIAYQMGVLRSLIRLDNHPIAVTVDGRAFFEGPALLAVVANGRYFGGSMMIAPHARVNDGLLDVILVRAMKRRDILSKIGRLYRGEHLDLPEVTWTRGKEIRMSSPGRVLLEMDGEQPGTLDATFRVLEEEIPFLCHDLRSAGGGAAS